MLVAPQDEPDGIDDRIDFTNVLQKLDTTSVITLIDAFWELVCAG